MSEILVVDEGFINPGTMRVINCWFRVPPSVIIADFDVIAQFVIVRLELPEMRQLGVPVGTTKPPLVVKRICTLSPTAKLLLSGACRRIWNSVVAPIVDEVSKVT